jgi:hypothetical protein
VGAGAEAGEGAATGPLLLDVDLAGRLLLPVPVPGELLLSVFARDRIVELELVGLCGSTFF